ncbi:thioesterase II family protein [Gynuella sp.]|uniref:thioesterase II family protein n=1 Tax=Gynuella sp. TaxID=2969146 RepID=UPI003D106A1D
MKWFIPIRQSHNPSIRLFLFPYAGGNARIFSQWKHLLPADIDIEVSALQMPGRAERLNEKPLESIDELIDILISELPLQDSTPYAFFGHSLGARIAYQLTRELKLRRKKMPEHLFVSAVRSPNLPRNRDNLHQLPDAEFLEKMAELGGTDEAALHNKELMELLLPALKADFKMIETCPPADPVPLDIHASLLFGKSDFPDTEVQHLSWQKHFHKTPECHVFDGGHFFIHDYTRDIVDIIYKRLKRHMMTMPI